jgi:hypothetical protein
MMLPVILAVIALVYLGIALVVARMCSINSRWEDLIDRIPNPRISARKVTSSLMPGDDDLLDEDPGIASHP